MTSTDCEIKPRVIGWDENAKIPAKIAEQNKQNSKFLMTILSKKINIKTYFIEVEVKPKQIITQISSRFLP